MRAYKLNIKFYSPMVYFHPPTIDSIIAFCIAKESARKEGLTAYYNQPQALPFHNAGLDVLHKIIKHKGGAHGVPVASYFQPDQEIEYLDSWKKRFDSAHAKIAHFGHGARRINTASGQFRSYNVPLDTKVVGSGSFFFIGDRQEVLRLLRGNIVGIGKKVSEGFGWIDRLSIEESDFIWRDILRLRPVPVSTAINYGIDGARLVCAWKPPYWKRENICECVVPEKIRGLE